jgi:hypothetical protein
MYTSSCSGICRGRKRRATRQRWRSRGKLHLPLLATNGVCHTQPAQRKVLDVFTCIRHHRALATAGTFAQPQRRAAHEDRRGDEDSVCRSARSDRPNHGALIAAAIFAARIWATAFPPIRCRRRRFADEFSAAADLRGNDFALRSEQRKGATANRPRTGADRKTGPAGIFPDRLGHRSFLPGEKYSSARPGLGGQQRGLLFAGDHRGGSGGNGTAVRAIFYRKSAASGRTSIWICPVGISASGPFSTSTSATANWERR